MDKISIVFLFTLISIYLRLFYLNSNIYHNIYSHFKYISYVMFILLLYFIKYLNNNNNNKFFIFKVILFVIFRFIYRLLIPMNYLKNNLYNCNDIIFIIGIFLFCYINI